MRNALIVCGLTAAALGGLIVLELQDPTPDVEQRPVARHALTAAPDRSPKRPPAQVAKRVDAILARPLFSPDRRPTPVAASGPAAAAVNGLPRLAGVLVSSFGRSAIFAPASGGKPLTAAEGARLGPYTVQSIEVGQVTVLGPDGVQVLHPSFDPNAARPENPTPAPSPTPAVPRVPGPGQRTSQPWQVQPPVASR